MISIHVNQFGTIWYYSIYHGIYFYSINKSTAHSVVLGRLALYIGWVLYMIKLIDMWVVRSYAHPYSSRTVYLSRRFYFDDIFWALDMSVVYFFAI